MHPEAMEFVARCAAQIDPARVIEFGAAYINGSARDAFGDVEWVGVDQTPGTGVDIVCDLETADELPTGFDLGVCCETLEHIRDVAGVFDRLVACVRPGGHVLVTVATDGRSPHNCDGTGWLGREHYRNVARWELVRPELEPIIEEVHSDRGDLYVFAVRT